MVLAVSIAWAAVICCSLPAIGGRRRSPTFRAHRHNSPIRHSKTVVNKTTFKSNGSVQEFGIGDTAFQAALIRDIDRHWAFGFGARLVAPTGEDSLGSGKWQIMPGFGVRYSFLEIGPDTYFVPMVRYVSSFAGDTSRRNISEPQIAPTLNIGLPDRWFVTFYPSNDIRINFGDPISGQTGRLFLPLDVAAGRKVTDSLVISLEAAVPIVNDYPVYKFKNPTPDCQAVLILALRSRVRGRDRFSISSIPVARNGISQRIVVECYIASWLVFAMSSAAIPSCRPRPRCAARAIMQIGRLGPTTTAWSAWTCKSIVQSSRQCLARKRGRQSFPRP